MEFKKWIDEFQNICQNSLYPKAESRANCSSCNSIDTEICLIIPNTFRIFELAVDNRHIQFCDGLTPPSDVSGYVSGEVVDSPLQQLQDLFNLGAFWAQDRSLDDLSTAIHYSQAVISAWDGAALIGFARVTSDCVYRANIWDVVVHPDYRGRGLGRKLVETVLAHPRVQKVERVYLMTTHQQQFYERIGFQVNSTTTMVLHQRPSDVASEVTLVAESSLSQP
jgi:N-acetylglutamate synthase-like GNAT family acetyltransferase